MFWRSGKRSVSRRSGEFVADETTTHRPEENAEEEKNGSRLRRLRTKRFVWFRFVLINGACVGWERRYGVLGGEEGGIGARDRACAVRGGGGDVTGRSRGLQPESSQGFLALRPPSPRVPIGASAFEPKRWLSKMCAATSASGGGEVPRIFWCLLPLHLAPRFRF